MVDDNEPIDDNKPEDFEKFVERQEGCDERTARDMTVEDIVKQQRCDEEFAKKLVDSWEREIKLSLDNKELEKRLAIDARDLKKRLAINSRDMEKKLHIEIEDIEKPKDVIQVVEVEALKGLSGKQLEKKAVGLVNSGEMEPLCDI